MPVLISASILITLAIIFPAFGQESNSQDISEQQKTIILNSQVATGDFTWHPQNFAGFYYDLDDDAGTEVLTATLTDGQLSGSEPFGLTYQTNAQEKPFSFQDWGSYSVIGFLGRKCLAGYMESTNPDQNLLFGKSKDANSIAKGQLEEVLLDDDAETVITTNSPLILKNGYKLDLKALNETDGRIYVELIKEAKVVHSKMFQLKDDAPISDATYYYKTDVEAQKGLVVIAVHFKNAFHASDQNIATIDGIFQISESPILVSKGTSFGKMKISTITSDQILMDNQGSPITLSKNKDVLLAWPSLYLLTADQSVVGDASPLRYCLYREIDSPGKYDVRGSVSTGDYTWTAQNFAGFYYDLDYDVGTETLTATLNDGKLSGDGYPYGLVYETTVQQKPFKFQDWGSYYVMGFLGEKCFAGYIEGSDSEKDYLFDKSTDRNALAKGQLLKVLADDDTERTITSNSSLKLGEGYKLALKSIDIDGNKARIELSKNGTAVDRKELQPSKDAATMADKTYYYKNPQVGGQKNLVTIAVHFKNAFRSADQSIATIDGIWQISDSPIEVKPDTQYDKMTIATVDTANGVITMDNKDYSITLSKHKDTLLMGSIYLQTANSDSLRYYVVKHEEIKDLTINKEETELQIAPSKENMVPSALSGTKLPQTDEENVTAVPAGTRQVGTDRVLVPAKESLIKTSDWGQVPANQVIVVLKDGKGRSDADRIAAGLGGQVVGNIGYINLYQIEISTSTEGELKSAIEKASKDPDVELAFPNQQVIDDMTIQGVQCSPLDDPVYTEKGRGKGYEMIGVQNAWDLMRASGIPINNVNVGVVDDGLYKGNDEFNGKTKIDTSVPDSELMNPNDQFGSHGTRVMNILAADSDNGGATGIASEPLKDKLAVSMVNRYAYGDNAMGSLLAINESISNGAKIISCSWGDTHAYPNTAKAYKKFFERMARDRPDVLFVCSAGNDGEVVDGTKRYPSGLNLPNMITVGNIMNDGTRAAGQIDENGIKATKSNMASDNFEITLAAPGEQVVKGFDNQGNLKNDNGGTSMATPQVTAAAAMIRALDPKLDAEQIKAILAQSARTTVDIDGKKVPAPPELGGRILAIDQAVLAVIKQLKPEFKDMTMDQVLGLARVKLVAKNESSSPQDWKVTADVLNVRTAGADVVIELQGEGAIGGDRKRHISQSGSLDWDVTAKDSATIVVQRMDTKGCSRVLLPAPVQGLSGNWTIWSIVPGTNTKLVGVGGFTKFVYKLNQSGNSVTFTGPTIFRELDIVGTLSGNAFTGTFIDHNPKSSKYGRTQGHVEVTFSADGKHFTGKQMMENWGSKMQWGGDKVS